MAGGGKQCELVVVVACLLLLAAASPVAYGQIPGTTAFDGRLCCTASGNCPPGALGIPNVTVSVNCVRLLQGVFTAAQNVTNSTGIFSVAVNGAVGSLGNIPCFASVNLPLSSAVCPVLSTVNGTLVGINSAITNVISPLLTILNVTGFITANVTL